MAHSKRGLSDVQDQRRLATRRPGVDLSIHLDTHVLFPLGLEHLSRKSVGHYSRGNFKDFSEWICRDKSIKLKDLDIRLRSRLVLISNAVD